MRSRLLLVPAAIVATIAAPTVTAKVYMDVAQARAVMFPGASFIEHFLTLNQAQFNAIIDDANVEVYSRQIKAWESNTGGWFILDQVRGKDDWITYAVGVDAKGVVQHIEVLECLDTYDGIKSPTWRAQFYGKRHGSNFEDIQTISGATLSSEQLTAGVKRVLSTLALALEP
jgi:Tfp pilus assembly protein PilE